MEHFYKNIPNHFDFEEIYSLAVSSFPTNSHFLEIGSYYGASTAFMAVEIINSGKNIQFDTVDCFGDDLYNEFIKNTSSVKHIVNLKRGKSKDIAEQYSDRSLDFIFIDGNHDYESISTDIIAWKSKLKLGGIIAGHDYSEVTYPGVVKAVKENFNSYTIHKGCWIVDNHYS